jgi:glycosyltransferase involved in cell wall biosynthesis
MACGTPVVAAPVEGVPEMITRREAGIVMPGRTVADIVTAVSAMLADPPSRAAVRRHAEGFSWDATTQGQLRIFRSALARQEAR